MPQSERPEKHGITKHFLCETQAQEMVDSTNGKRLWTLYALYLSASGFTYHRT